MTEPATDPEPLFQALSGIGFDADPIRLREFATRLSGEGFSPEDISQAHEYCLRKGRGGQQLGLLWWGIQSKERLEGFLRGRSVTDLKKGGWNPHESEKRTIMRRLEPGQSYAQAQRELYEHRCYHLIVWDRHSIQYAAKAFGWTVLQTIEVVNKLAPLYQGDPTQILADAKLALERDGGCPPWISR